MTLLCSALLCLVLLSNSNMCLQLEIILPNLTLLIKDTYVGKVRYIHLPKCQDQFRMKKGKPKSKCGADCWMAVQISPSIPVHDTAVTQVRLGCRPKKNAYVRGTYLPFRSARGRPGEVKGNVLYLLKVV